MAEDNKRNALFSKLFGKEKTEARAEENNENALLDELAEDKVTEAEAESENDYADWLNDAMAESAEDPDEDITDALAELFGEDVSEAQDGAAPIFSIPGFEDIAQSGEYEDLSYEAEDLPYEAEGNVAEEGAYEDMPAEYEEYPSEQTEEYYEPEYEVGAEALEYEDEEIAEFAEEDEAQEPVPPAEPTVDEDTATLLTALGYSDSNAEQIKSAPRKNAKTSKRTADLSLAYGYSGKEYLSHSQTSEIRAEYSRDRFRMLLRLGGTALFVIVLLVYDAFGKKFGGALDVTVYPVVNILISLQLLLVTAALSAKQVFAGINGIFKGDPIIHSISAAAVLLTVLYDVVLAISTPEVFTLYNFPAALCLLLGAVHDYLSLERQTYVFDRLSSWQSVATLERVDASELAVELGEAHVGEAGNKIGHAFRMRKGEFAENYFRHVNRRHPMAKILNFIIAPVIALSLVIFIISIASEKTAIEAFNACLTVNLFSLPSFMFLSMSYPFFILVSKNLNSDSVIFSEADVSEYKRVDTVVFEEADLFDEKSLTINRISVCDKNRMQDVFDIMCGVSALYNRIGGRIAGAFRASTAEGDVPTDVRVTSVEDGGFEGFADGRYYCVGSDTYLSSKGIAVTRYYDDSYVASNPGGVVLHIAVDGAEVFKLYLTYRISDSMLSVINELAIAKTRIVMRTVDPNVNLELITRILTSTFDGKLTLIRKPYVEADMQTAQEEQTKLDGGVLVNGESTESILDVVRACKLFGNYSKLTFNVNIVVFGAGALLSVFLGIIGALTGIPSLYIALFQMMSIIPSLLLANFLLK